MALRSCVAVLVGTGFFAVAEGPVVAMYRCPHGVCCPPFADSNAQRRCPLYGTGNETCAFSRTGLLCGECIDGYTEALGTYLCRQCQDGADIWVIVLGTAVLALGVAVVVYRGRMRRGSRSFLKILILKVALHFYQVCARRRGCHVVLPHVRAQVALRS